MRAVFFGTPEIAVAALDALVEVAEVMAVVCQPDRPAGRGLELKPPAVKIRAEALGLAVVQPTKIRTPDFAGWLRDQQADIALVIAYGRILPAAVLAAPRRGCMNLHASLLPKYRGAAPINWAIVRGETATGISLMQMDEGCDTGPVFSRRAIAIGPNETGGELYERLGELAKEVVREDLPRAVSGELAAEAQDNTLASEAPMLDRESGRIDWSASASRVHDLVRGMTPWPGAYCTISRGDTLQPGIGHPGLGEKRLKVLSTRVHDAEVTGGAGTVVTADKDAIVVACGEGAIRVLRGQLEGKKALDARELVSGRALAAGTRLI